MGWYKSPQCTSKTCQPVLRKKPYQRRLSHAWLKAAHPARRTLEAATRLIFPPHCIACNKALHSSTKERFLCASCWRLHNLSLLRDTASCLRCALPLPALNKPREPNQIGAAVPLDTPSDTPSDLRPALICPHCLALPPAFQRCRAIVSYELLPSQLIARLKTHHKLIVASFIAEQLSSLFHCEHLSKDRTLSKPQIDALIPVPLHAKRLKLRGFNQAEEIARCLGKQLDIPTLSGALNRLYDTPSQQQLSRDQRRKNLRGAFRANSSVLAGKRLVIIDDVITTTSTAREVAKTVCKAGATSCEVWSYARTADKPGKNSP